MFSKFKLSALAIATAALLGTATTGANAGVLCAFDSAGGPNTGVDCLGHAWEFENDRPNGIGPNGSWGIPGAGEGLRPFLGDIAHDFHITFDLPDGTEINTAAGLGSDFTSFGVPGDSWATQFMDMSGNNAIDTVWFLAPEGNPILNGEDFFVNVIFTQPIPTGAQGVIGYAFEASWTIPEPGSFAILGLGLVGLGLVRRKLIA